MKPKATISIRKDDFHITSQGADVEAQVTASIEDSRSNICYVWKLRVMDQTTKSVVVDDLYRDKLVRRKEGETKFRPKFDEKFQLPPGRYSVQVILYDVPPNFPLDLLNDPSSIESESHLAASGGKTISVTAD